MVDYFKNPSLFTMLRMERTRRHFLTNVTEAFANYYRELAKETEADGHPEHAKALVAEAEVMEANLAELVSHMEAEFVAFVHAKQVAT